MVHPRGSAPPPLQTPSPQLHSPAGGALRLAPLPAGHLNRPLSAVSVAFCTSGPWYDSRDQKSSRNHFREKVRLSHKCFQVSYEERTASPSIHQQEKEGALDQSPLRRVTEVWLWQKATPSCCTPPPSGLCANTQHVGPPWVSWVSVTGWRGLTHHVRTPVSEIITNTHLFTGGRDGTGRICYSQCIRQISEREIC